MSNTPDINKAKELLLSSKNNLLNHLRTVLKSNKFSYLTFGTEIQPHISEFLIKLFQTNGFNSYAVAKDKNEFPDFTLKTTPPLAIEYKCGNVVQKVGTTWVDCENSENDMGTLNSWDKKLNQFGGPNIYYVFVIYHFDDTAKDIIEVQIDIFYKFLGLNKDGVLKYREKDGNLRPKNFDSASKITTLEEFLKLLKRTDIYRSKRLVQKHIEHLPPEDKRRLLDDLK